MAYSDCVAAIKAAAPGLSDDDVLGVVEAVQRRERGMADRRGDALRWRDAAREESQEEVTRAAARRRGEQINLMRRVEREDRYAANPDPVQAISDLLTTSARAGEGRAMSTEAAQRSAQDTYRGAFLADLQRSGGLPLVRHLDAGTELALVREVARLNGASGVAAATDERIKALALVFAKHGERVRQDLNAAGADIGRIEGYVVRQSHDMRRVRGDGTEAAFRAWRDATAPRLAERTFIDSGVDLADGEAAELFLRRVWSNLASGNHHVAAPAEAAEGFTGPGNLARRLSEDRVLHFRGPDEWLEYNREFGSGNLMVSMLGGLDHGAKALGLLQQWGTNPEAAFRGDVQRIADRLRDEGDVVGSSRLLQAAPGKLEREWRTVSGDADRPVNTTLARVGGTIRTLEAVARLGGVVISSITDMPVRAAALSHEGVSYWGSVGSGVSALLEGTPPGVRGEVALRLSAGVNGLLGGLFERMGYGEGAVPGTLARGADLFMKANLQTYWQDAMERATGLTLSAHMGENLAARGWADLEVRFRDGLARYGITEQDWRLAQGVELLREGGEGARYFTPDMLDELGDAVDWRGARERFGAWFASTMDTAITRPGAYERSLLTLGQSPGTVLGESLRLLTQFKSFPLSFLTRHLTREWTRAGSVPEAIGNIGGLMAATTLLGYVAMTLKDLAKGRNPREPEDAGDWVKLVGAAMTQGGGAGILGDFLFAEYNRAGTSPVATLGGPTIGSAETLLRFFATAIRAGRDAATGDDVHGNLGGQAVNIATREVLPRAAAFIPGGVLLNTFYGQMAARTLMTDALMEWANPGFLARSQRRIERENNQTFWLDQGALVR